jgi:dienelactone hydrolase
VGKGHVDFLEVWADVFDSFSIDRDRVYVTGHSMGGWGSYLLTLLYPDRFAAAAPYAGPVTQGAWTGADFEGCDEFEFDGNTPCYIEANGSIPRDQHTRKILENSLHVPYAIMHGTSDELVPYSGVARQAERLFQLGHRFRFYTYPGYEHYSHPVMDQWSEAARYLHSFTRPENPAHVTYKRDMPFETATERVQSDGLALNFDFDSAYWLSELTAVDSERGTAMFDGTSLAIPSTPHLVAPDTGAPTGPGTTGPYVITGQQWIDDPTAAEAASENGFEATLTGASIARLDLSRMSIDTGESSFGRVTTDGPAILRLDGGWASAPTVTIDGQETAVAFDEGVVSIPLPEGSSVVVVTPGEATEEGPAVIGFTDASDRSGQYSDDATLQAVLVDGSGQAVADAPVTFDLGGNSVSTTTNESGVATAILALTEAPGDHELTASYSAGEASAEQTIGFTITTEDTALSLSSDGKGSKTTWVAMLTDADSSAGVAGRTIEFFADGTSVGTATTGGDGTASFSPPPRYRNPSTREASFSGDDYYRSSHS